MRTITLTQKEIDLLILATYKAEAVEQRIDTKRSRERTKALADLRKKLNEGLAAPPFGVVLLCFLYTLNIPVCISLYTLPS